MFITGVELTKFTSSMQHISTQLPPTKNLKNALWTFIKSYCYVQFFWTSCCVEYQLENIFQKSGILRIRILKKMAINWRMYIGKADIQDLQPLEFSNKI